MTDPNKLVMLFDATLCTGCRGCESACREYNGHEGPAIPMLTIPFAEKRPLTGTAWTKIQYREVKAGEGVGWNFLKAQCMHCADANCVTACPSGAQTIAAGGRVYIDGAKCFGCQYCVLACPYEVPSLVPAEGITQKCSFCVDRTDDGLAPMCVQTCPPNALAFGKWSELEPQAVGRAERLRAAGMPGASVYGNGVLGGLGALYVLPEDPARYGLAPFHRSLKATALASWALSLLWVALLLGAPVVALTYAG